MTVKTNKISDNEIPRERSQAVITEDVRGQLGVGSKSGVNYTLDAIQEVPNEWILSRIKFWFQTIAGGTPSVDNDSFWDDAGLPWLTIGDMSKIDVVRSTTRGVSQSGIASKSLPIGEPGTIVFAMYASIGEVAELGVHASWNQAILGFSPNNKQCSPSFLKYWLKAIRNILPKYYRITTQSNLNAQDVQNLPLLVPPISVQSQIVSYLDNETSRIDELTGELEHQKSLLQERRQAVITEAVAGNIESAQFTTLGVKQKRLKHCCIIVGEYGLNISSESYLRNGIRLIRISDILENGRLTPDCNGVYVDDESEVRGLYLEPGDLLFSRSGTIGRSFLVGQLNVPATFAGYLVRFRVKPEYDPTFIYYVSLSKQFREQIDLDSIQSVIRNFNANKFANLLIPIFDLHTQRQVVSYLDKETSRIDELISEIDNQISLLKERRQALITAAVTGQIDVSRMVA